MSCVKNVWITVPFSANLVSPINNKQKLIRKRKLEDTFSSSTDEIFQDTEESSESTRTTRPSLTLRNFQSFCFFCDQVDDQKKNLLECQTIASSSRVKKIAVELSDTKCIAKLR